MGKDRWKILLGLSLVIASAILYSIHYFIFADWHHIAIYLLGDIAFVPLEVLLVTLILHELLERRERSAKLQKLNMAIGVFFAEMGSSLLGRLRRLEQSGALAAAGVAVDGSWSPQAFREAKARVAALPALDFDTGAAALEALRTHLLEKRPFLLTLLENPNLLEHEAFTDALWAVFHLTDELAQRDDLAALPEPDRRHLQGDMQRACQHLIAQWFSYMQHLKKDYPYLFSLAVRTNPFAEATDPRVRS